MAKYRGTGAILSTDYKDVQWTGKTKDDKNIIIVLENAINLGNIDWAFAEKNDTVAQIVMTATYGNTDNAATDTKEPWTIEIDGEVTEGASEIILGTGMFSVDGKDIALTRGGGSLSVAREFREINADGDRGPVKDRIVMDASRATLTMNVLTILARLTDLYVGIAEETE